MKLPVSKVPFLPGLWRVGVFRYFAILVEIRQFIQLATLLRFIRQDVFHHFIVELLGITKPDDNVISSTSITTITKALYTECFEGGVAEGFDIFILLNSLADYSQKAKESIDSDSFKSNDEKKAYDFFKTNTCHIEILVEGKLKGIYFPIKPVCHHLSRNTRKKFL